MWSFQKNFSSITFKEFLENSASNDESNKKKGLIRKEKFHFLIKLVLKSLPVKWNFTDSGRPERTEKRKINVLSILGPEIDREGTK